MTCLEAALSYAARGWRVLPIRPGDKRPLSEHGCKDASTDPQQIAQWWATWPSAAVGIATGAESGLVVLDVDAKTGGLEALPPDMPITPTARTGGGGKHFLFKHPGGRVFNSASKVGPGLDIRADGGYIVAAPSQHKSGTPYSWEHPPETPVADLPVWLRLKIHQKADRAPRPHVPGQPASPSVLRKAKAKLAELGPATEGQGGDAHTFRVCATLARDFALSDEEALPLLQEWNATCVPPWDENDLMRKLDNARAYASGDEGSRLSVVEQARRAVEQMRKVGGDDAVQECVETCRQLVAASAEPLDRAAVQALLVEATGLGVQALALPKTRRPVLAVEQPAQPSGTIEDGPDRDRVATESLAAISGEVYAWTGQLAQISDEPRRAVALGVPAIREVMSRNAKYVRYNATTGAWNQVPPPEDVAAMLKGRVTLPGVRVLERLTNAPVFLADGSVLSTPGYNETARCYVLEDTPQVTVSDGPSQDDARSAAARLLEQFSDFPCVDDAARAALLAAILSPLVKGAIDNAPVPLFCITASTPGTGKTKLAECIARLVTGRSFLNRPYSPRPEDEWNKCVTAFVREGAAMGVFDNLERKEFGDPVLDRLLTSSEWAGRVLGVSNAPPMPVSTVWYATGNNIMPKADTARRCIMLRLDAQMERPDTRTGFKYPDINRVLRERRAELLGYAMTVLRAYHCAGRPAQGLKPWGGFDEWTDAVRAPLVWAGCADPGEARCQEQEFAADTDELEELAAYLQIFEKPQTAAEALRSSEVRTRLAEYFETATLTPKRLSKRLIRHRGRILQGRKLTGRANGDRPIIWEAVTKRVT